MILFIYFVGFHKSTRCLQRIAIAEPNAPNIQTEIPGPKSRQLMKELSAVQVGIFSTHACNTI